MRYWQCKADQSTEFRLYRGKGLHLPKGDIRKTRFFVLEAREFIHVRLHYVDIVIAPVLIGGKETSTLIDGESLTTMDDLKKLGVLQLESCETLKYSYIRLKYKVIT